MLITRATRHDESDRRELFTRHGDEPTDHKATHFIARDGAIVGNVSVFEVEPGVVVVEDVLVADSHRDRGIGRQLVQAAMNSRGGTLYLCCHPERLRFYGHFGFAEVPFEELPAGVRDYFEASGDAPSKLPEGHVHHFMKAR